MFFTERRHSERSALGLTGSYETGRIDQAEVRTKCANSILPDGSGKEKMKGEKWRCLSSSLAAGTVRFRGMGTPLT